MSKKQITIIISALLFLCCFGLIFAGVLMPKPEATPTAEVLPATKSSTDPSPTNVPAFEPTALLKPTAAPIPTKTAAPTNTPTPEPTATPTPSGPSPEVQSYLNAVAGHMQNLSGALQTISDLTSSPNLFSDDWKIRMAAQLAMIRITHQALTEMDVPDEMQAMHSAILDATADCDSATYHLAEGIDSLDTTEIQIATDLVRSCGEKIKIPLQMISEY